MARRIIRTVDGQTFSDRPGHFEDGKGYILYKKGPFNKVKINKRNITTDDTSGLPTSVLMFGAFLLSLVLMVTFVSFNRQGESSGIQSNLNITQKALPNVIASKLTGFYYLPECPGYKEVMPQNRVGFVTEQQALKAGYQRSAMCPN